MSRSRRIDENQAATAEASPEQQRRVQALREIATDRKLLLLDCGIVRLAPFSENGRTIWELLPGFSWFTNHRVSALRREPPMMNRINAHEAIVIVEQLADGRHRTEDLSDARDYLRWTEYAAEADRFEDAAQRAIGSELRYGVADWIDNLADIGPSLKNILDYYLAAFTGNYYAWACYLPLHADHRSKAIAVIDDIFGNPFRPVAFSPAWRTDTTVSIAHEMYESRDFSVMPILADALQDAGCDNDDILDHCRGPGPHVRGCWVVDLVLGKE